MNGFFARDPKGYASLPVGAATFLLMSRITRPRYVLSLLEDAGLISVEKQGRQRIYILNFEKLQRVVSILVQAKLSPYRLLLNMEKFCLRGHLMNLCHSATQGETNPQIQ